MTSGEMEFEEIFQFQFIGNQDTAVNSTEDVFFTSGGLHYFTLSTVLWVIFVILMPILFINLLVSVYSIASN